MGSLLSEEGIQKIVYEKLGWQVLNIERNKGKIFVVLKDEEGYMYGKIFLQVIQRSQRPLKHKASNIYTLYNINHWCELNNLDIKLIDNQIYKSNDRKLRWKCLDCNKMFERNWNNIQSGQTSCTHCGDGISYPEKFGRNMFEQLNINYISKYTFPFAKTFEYDFVFNNKVIEFHGRQHYERGFEYCGGRTLEEEQENDRLKKELAEANGFKYIEIDARESEMEWIKNSILNSELAKIFDLSQIDWLKCHEMACKSLVKEVCELWNSGIKNSNKISKIVRLERNAVIRYLKQGVQLNWCDYNPEMAIKENGIRSSKNSMKPIIQIDKKENFIKMYDSLMEAQKETGVHNACISACCHGAQKTAGGFKWMFKTDYEKLSAS